MKAQVAMEYLGIFSLTFFMTLVLIIIFTTQANNIQTDITNAQIDRVANEIGDAVNEVYFMGEPAQKTIRLQFPDGIQTIEVQTRQIIFNISTADLTYQYVKEVETNITGSLQTFEGTHAVVVKAQGNQVVISDS